MNIYRKISATLITISYLSALYLYSRLPSDIATHWSLEGAVNGYSQKLPGLFLLPSVLLFIFLLFLLLPKIDPLGKNVEKFRDYFDLFITTLITIMTYIFFLTLAWNMGARFPFNIFITPALSLIFYVSGVLLGKAKRNWFIGIRTPWTLQNDIVWDKTHQLGEKLYKASAVVSLLGILIPSKAFYFIIIPIIISSLATIVYSYISYRKFSSSDKN